MVFDVPAEYESVNYDVLIAPVGLDGSGRILHLHVLVAHQRPGPETARAQFQRSLEIQSRFLMLTPHTVVITYTINTQN